MIEVENLSKRYGTKLAVDSLSFVVQPGIVTGFLGPNGSGKSTTMRMIAGLDKPTAGRVTLNGGRYRTAAAPMAELGVLLEAKAVHTGRSARNHLLALAQTNGITARRVDEVIDIVGLRDVAGKRVGGFSLGMGQRLGVASALLGNPQTVVLDEPVNGLDPEGVRWIRTMLKDLAADGHTVFVSSQHQDLRAGDHAGRIADRQWRAVLLGLVGRQDVLQDPGRRSGGSGSTTRHSPPPSTDRRTLSEMALPGMPPAGSSGGRHFRMSILDRYDQGVRGRSTGLPSRNTSSRS
jgi:ABC-type Na+ transport system ATPase subunit NatA